MEPVDLNTCQEACSFCRMPYVYLKCETVEDHLDSCKEFDRTKTKECPKRLECDCNTSIHFLRYNHSPEKDMKSPRKYKKIRKKLFNNNLTPYKKSTNLKTLNSIKKHSDIPDKVNSIPPCEVNENLQSVKKSLPVNQVPDCSIDVKKFITKQKQQPITQYFAAQSAKSTNKMYPTNVKSLPLHQIEKIEPQEIRTSRKQCPFYKKIKDTSIAVDAFSYGSIPGINIYLLSHFHSDHYQGLTKKFAHKVYCSKITANLVMLSLRLTANQIKVLPMNEPVIINGTEVILLEANHCPGSVMFLFILSNGVRHLHTGDFRANRDMENSKWLSPGYIDHLYLDTTYCDPRYCFPEQGSVLNHIKSLALKALQTEPKTLFVCGVYTIGKEKVFTAISTSFNLKIWGNQKKLQTLRSLDNQELDKLLEANRLKAQVHLLPMNLLKLELLQKHLENLKSDYRKIIAFKPTGWEFRRSQKSVADILPKFYKDVTLYGIPYSEHSSYEELKRFVQHVRPNKIVPTVNMGESKERDKMESIFKSWKC